MENETVTGFANHVIENNDSDSSKFGSRIADYTDAEISVLACVFLFLVVFGVGINGSVLYMFIVKRSLHTPMNALFMSLTVCDLGVSITASFISLIHIVGKMKMSDAICDLYGFLSYASGVGNIHALSVIALERFLTISNPCNIGPLRRRRATMLLAYTWSFAVIQAVMPLTGFSSYVHEGPGFWCSVEWEDDSVSGDGYIFFIFISSFFLPLGIIVFSYVLVYSKVKEVAKAGISTQSAQMEKMVLRQTYAMVAGFLVAWTPYAVVCLIASSQRDNPFSPKAALVPSIFAKFSTCYNSVIYLAFNKQFRKEYVSIFCSGKAEKFSRKPDVEVSQLQVTYGKTAPNELTTKTNRVAPIESDAIEKSSKAL